MCFYSFVLKFQFWKFYEIWNNLEISGAQRSENSILQYFEIYPSINNDIDIESFCTESVYHSFSYCLGTWKILTDDTCISIVQ